MGSRIASTKGQKGRDASGDFDVVDSSVTLAEKGAVAVKFKCGVNASTDENKGTAENVEKTPRVAGEIKRSVRQAKASHVYRPTFPHTKRSETATRSYLRGERKSQDPRLSSEYYSDPESRPPTRPESDLGMSYRASGDHNSVLSDDFDVQGGRRYNYELDKAPSKSGHHPASQSGREISPTIPRSLTMSTKFELNTRPSPELITQLIARSLKIDFVYIVRLTSGTDVPGESLSKPHSDIDLKLLGSYGLPFPELNFDKDTHLKALQSEQELPFYDIYLSGKGNKWNKHPRIFFKVGVIMALWRYKDRTSFQSITTSSIIARAGSTFESSESRRSNYSASTNGTHRHEDCHNGVVVGAFSNRSDRIQFGEDEKSYLRSFKTLKGHM